MISETIKEKFLVEFEVCQGSDFGDHPNEGKIAKCMRCIATGDARMQSSEPHLFENSRRVLGYCPECGRQKPQVLINGETKMSNRSFGSDLTREARFYW